MRRTRYLQSLLAAAALAAPLLAAADPRHAVTAIGGPDSVARDVNKLGQVAAYLGVDSLPGNPGDIYPRSVCLYENGAMIDLNTLTDPASGWTITDAAAINELQQIAAQACRGGVCQAVRLDLVSAVPEPPTFALVAAGLALGLARGKSFRRPVRRRRG